MTLVVEENLANGVPQTALRGFAPAGIGWHWTAGGSGRAGWEASLRHLISTRLTVNASYHGGFWHEHAPAGACRTFVQWVVATSKAAHSIAPSQVFRLNAAKDRATQDARFAEVRRILGAKATDPNAGCIALAYAGMPEGLQKDLACPVFRADLQSLAQQLVAHPAVIDRPHFGHGWIQPISRYEMDVATDFIGLLYGGPAIPQEDGMPNPPLRYKPELWRTKASGTDLRLDPVMLTTNKVGLIPPGTAVFTVAESEDGVWRLAVAGDPEGLFWVVRGAMDPLVQGGDPDLHAGIASVVSARMVGHPVPSGDCETEVAQAEQETTAHVNQEWRDWLATAPAAAGDPT